MQDDRTVNRAQSGAGSDGSRSCSRSWWRRWPPAPRAPSRRRKQTRNWVEIVTQGTIPTEHVPANTHYFSDDPGAVNAAHEGDWVLIEAGHLQRRSQGHERARRHPHPRHGPQHRDPRRDGHRNAGNGTPTASKSQGQRRLGRKPHRPQLRHAQKAQKAPAATRSGGTAAVDSNKVGAHGWFGKYLTAYDTGLNGGYGIFTQNETEGEWEHIYASGFNDSGIYIGACQECKAHVNNATMENNAVGYSGSNSGGNAGDRKLAASPTTPPGSCPNGENPGDGPPPSERRVPPRNVKNPVPYKNPNPVPRIKSTEIERCTIFRKNMITENNNLTCPRTGHGEGAVRRRGRASRRLRRWKSRKRQSPRTPPTAIMAFEYPNPFTKKRSQPRTAKKPKKNAAPDRLLPARRGTRSPRTRSPTTATRWQTYAGDIFMFRAVSSRGARSGSRRTTAWAPAEKPTRSVTRRGRRRRHWKRRAAAHNETTPNPSLSETSLVLHPGKRSMCQNTTGRPTGQPAPAGRKRCRTRAKASPQNPLCPTTNRTLRRHARRAKARKARSRCSGSSKRRMTPPLRGRRRRLSARRERAEALPRCSKSRSGHSSERPERAGRPLPGRRARGRSRNSRLEVRGLDAPGPAAPRRPAAASSRRGPVLGTPITLAAGCGQRRGQLARSPGRGPGRRRSARSRGPGSSRAPRASTRGWSRCCRRPTARPSPLGDGLQAVRAAARKPLERRRAAAAARSRAPRAPPARRTGSARCALPAAAGPLRLRRARRPRRMTPPLERPSRRARRRARVAAAARLRPTSARSRPFTTTDAHAGQAQDPQLLGAVGLLRAVPVGVLAVEVGDQRRPRARSAGRRSGSWRARAPSASARGSSSRSSAGTPMLPASRARAPPAAAR